MYFNSIHHHLIRQNSFSQHPILTLKLHHANQYPQTPNLHHFLQNIYPPVETNPRKIKTTRFLPNINLPTVKMQSFTTILLALFSTVNLASAIPVIKPSSCPSPLGCTQVTLSGPDGSYTTVASNNINTETSKSPSLLPTLPPKKPDHD